MQVRLNRIGTRIPCRAVRGAVESNPKRVSDPIVVYLIPSTVSITVTSRVPDVLAVLVVVGAGGAGAGAPLVGTSPARTVIDISPVRATANTKRFMF